MEARRTWLCTVALLLAPAAGCQLPGMNAGPSGRTGQQPPDDEERAEVVATAPQPAEPADDQPSAEDDPIQAYLQNVALLGDLRARVQREPAFSPNPEPYEPVEYEPEAAPAGAEPPLSESREGMVASESAKTDAAESSEPVDAAAGGSNRAGAEPAEAPRIVGVSARANLPAAALVSDASGAEPGVNAATFASEWPELAALLNRLGRQPEDRSFRRQLDVRLLRVLAGDYEGAREPLELVSQQQQEMAAGFVEAMITLREGHGGDLASEASRVLARLEDLRGTLVTASDLRVRPPVICRSVLGYGLYEPIEPALFRAGQYAEFVAYCEVGNLVTEPQEDGTHVTLLDVRTTILSHAGDIVSETRSDGVRTVWRDARHDCFLAPVVSLPATLAPGQYVVKITVADRIGRKVAESSVTFRIVQAS